MIRRIARYQIRIGEEDAVLTAIRTFVAAVHANEPRTTYDAYRVGETLEFVHFMAFPDASAEERHRGASYTHEFVSVLYPRCEVEPAFSELVPVDGKKGV